MCAIVDNDVRDQVFGANSRSPAGQFFLDWLSNGRGKIVVGGQLLRELNESGDFKRWLQAALRRNIALAFDDDQVDAETEAIRARQICRSNDVHVLALARVSGARLLFTNVGALKQDFMNPDIIPGASGRIYSTNRGRRIRRYATQEIRNVTKAHRSLLNRTDLCAI